MLASQVSKGAGSRQDLEHARQFTVYVIDVRADHRPADHQPMPGEIFGSGMDYHFRPRLSGRWQ